MVNVSVLETSRLNLRGFRNEDFERYATMWTEPAVVRFIDGAALSHKAAWSRFLRQAGHWNRLGVGFFAIEERATGAFLGEARHCQLSRPCCTRCVGGAVARVGSSFARLLCCPALTERGRKKAPWIR